jgi:hypothetical protein
MRCRRVRFSEKSQEDFVILSGPVRLASLAQGKLGGAEGSRGIAAGSLDFARDDPLVLALQNDFRVLLVVPLWLT